MELWLKSLKTATPQEGFELAIKLSQKGVQYTQPSEAIRKSCVQSIQETLTASSPSRRLLPSTIKRWPPPTTTGVSKAKIPPALAAGGI